jgi:hypothetical protein
VARPGTKQSALPALVADGPYLKAMRILTVVDYLGPGGTQRAAVNYSLGYKRHGCDVAVLAYWDGGPRVAELEAAGIKLFIKPSRVEERFIKTGGRLEPDVIHVHGKNPDDCP